MASVRLPINAAEGLHARPAQLFCRMANQFVSDIQVRNATTASAYVNAKSILSVLKLGVAAGHEVEITAEGQDATKALESLERLVIENFNIGSELSSQK